MRRAIFAVSAAVAVATLQCGCSTAPPERSWQQELNRSSVIRKQQGAEAALEYLLLLPKQLARNEHASRMGEYKRLRTVAGIENSLGRWNEAEQHLQQCLTLSRSEKSGLLTAQTQVARFNPLQKLNRFKEAEQSLQAARGYVQSSHDESLNRFILHNTGLLLEKTGHFEEAVAPLNAALQASEAAHDNGLIASVHINLGWAYYQLGHLDKARDEYMAAQAGQLPQFQHLCLGHLGNLAFEQRQFAEAAQFYRRAAEASRKDNPDYCVRWLTNEAAAWIELKEWKKAAARNQEAFDLGDKLPKMSERQLALVNRARIAAGARDVAGALQQLSALVADAREPGPTLDAYSELMRIYQEAGKPALSEAAFDSGIRLIDRQRTELQDLDNKLSFAAKAMKFNQQYVAGLMASGNAEKAFEAAEASRARTLRDNLNLPGQAMERGGLTAFRALAQRTGQAYLAYWVAPGKSYVWVITPVTSASYTLAGESELRDRVNRFQLLVEKRKDAAAEGAALFQTLVAPALKQLKGIEQVVIVPDGALYGLNFETLRQGSRTAPYWIENATLTVAPAMSLLLAEKRDSVKNRNMLLLGDASEWTADFPPLINSTRELNGIAARFPIAEQTRLTGARATPAGYEQQPISSFRYIHFATHATANGRAPLESAIVLSRHGDRGKLTARDILKLPVQADLVSISACGSAGARTYSGEGLVGLAWAFLRAGAHSVVAGLWDVSDYSSPLIMSGLYGGLAQGEDAPHALRAAKLELLKPGSKYADPYYWGPFLLYRGAGSN